jgi:hypothetical protein
VPFPQLDTFPRTLFGNVNQNLGIRAQLAATSETKSRLQDIGRLIGTAIDVDIREALLNDLAALGEAYAEGWQSSSGSDAEE